MTDALSADPASKQVFRDAFAAVGLPYANPHSYRKTLARLGERLCQTPEEWKAWSQNMGHDSEATTFVGYGEVASHRQKEIMTALANPHRQRSNMIIGLYDCPCLRRKDHRRRAPQLFIAAHESGLGNRTDMLRWSLDVHSWGEEQTKPGRGLRSVDDPEADFSPWRET